MYMCMHTYVHIITAAVSSPATHPTKQRDHTGIGYKVPYIHNYLYTRTHIMQMNYNDDHPSTPLLFSDIIKDIEDSDETQLPY